MQQSSLYFFFKPKKKLQSGQGAQQTSQNAVRKRRNTYATENHNSKDESHKTDKRRNTYSSKPPKKPSKRKVDQYPSKHTITYPSKIKADLETLECTNGRTVFIDLDSFHQKWRSIPSNMLLDTIIILPNVYIEWILNPSKNDKIPKNVSDILSDIVFLNLLQWKHQQCSLFCMLNSKKTIKSWNISSAQLPKNIAPFWYYFSSILSELSEPLTYNTSNYNPLIFDTKYYRNKALYRSKYGVTSNEIIAQLQSTDEHVNSCKVISEILYQSNPSLNIIMTEMECDSKVDESQNHSPSTPMIESQIF